MSHRLICPDICVKNREVLDRTLVGLGWEPSHYEASYGVAGTRVQNCLTVQIPSWNCRVAFEQETGHAHFDNYSPYGPNHPEVKSGHKRVGDEGRWGSADSFYRLVDSYNAELLKEETEGVLSVEQHQRADGAIELVFETI